MPKKVLVLNATDGATYAVPMEKILYVSRERDHGKTIIRLEGDVRLEFPTEEPEFQELLQDLCAVFHD